MRSTLLILLCGLLSLQTEAVAQEVPKAIGTRVVVVGGDHNYPPYEFLDKDGRPAGFCVDMTRAIAEVMGMSVDIRLGEWNEVRRGLEDGSIDEPTLYQADFCFPVCFTR